MTEAKDFSQLSNENLEKWQGIYSKGLKEVAVEKGKREALNEYQSLQNEFQKYIKLNNSLQGRMKQVKDIVYLRESVDIDAIKDKPKNILKELPEEQEYQLILETRPAETSSPLKSQPQKSPAKAASKANSTYVVYSSESDPDLERNSQNSDHKCDDDSDNISIASTLLKQDVKFRTREWSKDGTARDRYLNEESLVTQRDSPNESQNEQDVRQESDKENYDKYEEKIIINTNSKIKDEVEQALVGQSRNPLETPEQYEKTIDRKYFY